MNESQTCSDVDHPLQGQDTQLSLETPSGQDQRPVLDPAFVSEIIEMALNDHVSFSQIRIVHGLSPDRVKALMRQHLAPASYRAWRRRVRNFSDRRAIYK